MTDPPTPIKRQCPRALADRADDGFLSVVRSAGRALGSLSSGTVKGLSKVGQVLVGTKQDTPKRQTEPMEAVPPRQLDRKLQPPASQPPSADSPSLDGPSLDMETLLEEHSPQDADQATILRQASNDLLHGSEEAAAAALETLAGLGQVAEPLLIACLQTESPRVVEIALEGLSLIGSQRFAGCLSDVLDSSDIELRLIAVRATRRLPDEQQKQPLLARGLRDIYAGVRRCALSCLCRNDSHWAAAEAFRLYDDKQPDVQWAAVEAMMVMRPSEAHGTLQLMMPSLAPEYQRRAAVLLGKCKDQGASPQMNGKPRQNDAKEG